METTNPQINPIEESLMRADGMLQMHDPTGAYAILLLLEGKVGEMQDVQKSFFFFLKARYCELIGDHKWMFAAAKASVSFAQTNEQKAQATNLLAGAYLKLYQENQNDKELLTLAEQELDNSIAYAKNCPNKALLLEPLRFKSWLARSKKDYDTAFKLLNEAAAIADELHINVELSVIICQIADIYSLRGEKNIALSEYYRAERYAHDGGDYNHYCRVVLHRLAAMFELGGEYAEKAKADIINIAHQKI